MTILEIIACISLPMICVNMLVLAITYAVDVYIGAKMLKKEAGDAVPSED